MPVTNVQQDRPRLAIAGASGFIGTAVCQELARDYEIIALTRSPARARTQDPRFPITWCHCDLFSMRQVAAALKGAEFAIYLVHSLAPSARLTQAKPRDMDLLIADNFARAAARNGLKQVIFIGAVVPDGFRIAPLLWSRRETEMTLASHGAPITTLRADLVVGPASSSLKMLVKLVKRLPILPLPRAARSHTQPIALVDLLRAIRFCLSNPRTYRKHFDVGGPEPLSYQEILRQTAAVLGLRRTIFTLPLPLWLVAPFVRLFSGAPYALVQPLVESLPQDTVIKDNLVQQAIKGGALTYQRALKDAIDPKTKELLPHPRLVNRDEDIAAMREASVVRSIQRIILPPGENAAWVSGNYFHWLPRLLWPFVDCQFDKIGSCSIYIRFPRLHILSLTFKPDHSTPNRRMYFITGGLLARTNSDLQGRLEFRDALDGRFTIAAIHDFPPSIPWYVYNSTQAIIHLVVMRIYQRRLARLAR